MQLQQFMGLPPEENNFASSLLTRSVKSQLTARGSSGQLTSSQSCFGTLTFAKKGSTNAILPTKLNATAAPNDDLKVVLDKLWGGGCTDIDIEAFAPLIVAPGCN